MGWGCTHHAAACCHFTFILLITGHDPRVQPRCAGAHRTDSPAGDPSRFCMSRAEGETLILLTQASPPVAQTPPTAPRCDAPCPAGTCPEPPIRCCPCPGWARSRDPQEWPRLGAGGAAGRLWLQGRLAWSPDLGSLDPYLQRRDGTSGAGFATSPPVVQPPMSLMLQDWAPRGSSDGL